jgi:hypothetical protein
MHIYLFKLTAENVDANASANIRNAVLFKGKEAVKCNTVLDHILT